MRLITKEQLKSEIENVPSEHWPVLYRIIRALEEPAAGMKRGNSLKRDWRQFVAETYGCMADAPIERGDQARFEIREDFG